eukprot:COSAG03_NODE_21776_length_299_cov_1.215000_1_plen_32_part_10
MAVPEGMPCSSCALFSYASTDASSLYTGGWRG